MAKGTGVSPFCAVFVALQEILPGSPVPSGPRTPTSAELAPVDEKEASQEWLDSAPMVLTTHRISPCSSARPVGQASKPPRGPLPWHPCSSPTAHLPSNFMQL